MTVIYTLTKSSLVKSGGQLHWNIDSPSEQTATKDRQWSGCASGMVTGRCGKRSPCCG